MKEYNDHAYCKHCFFLANFGGVPSFVHFLNLRVRHTNWILVCSIWQYDIVHFFLQSPNNHRTKQFCYNCKQHSKDKVYEQTSVPFFPLVKEIKQRCLLLETEEQTIPTLFLQLLYLLQLKPKYGAFSCFFLIRLANNIFLYIYTLYFPVKAWQSSWRTFKDMRSVNLWHKLFKLLSKQARIECHSWGQSGLEEDTLFILVCVIRKFATNKTTHKKAVVDALSLKFEFLLILKTIFVLLSFVTGKTFTYIFGVIY